MCTFLHYLKSKVHGALSRSSRRKIRRYPPSIESFGTGESRGDWQEDSTR